MSAANETVTGGEPKVASSADGRPRTYRWVIEALVFVAFFAQGVTWLAPAPILDPIIHSLDLSLGEAGLVISIISLCISVFAFLGGLIVERLGALRTMLLGLWLMAGGGIASGGAQTLGVLLGCRVLEGIGFGLMIAPPGTLIMQWFGDGEWPWINTVNALCSYVAVTAMYAATVPIFYAFHSSWRAVLLIYGVGAAAVALLWSVLGHEPQSATVPTGTAAIPAGSSILEVVAMRDVSLIALATFGGMWVYQLYTAFLPQFFHVYHGLGLKEASDLTAILTLAGIFSAAGAGFGTAMLGLRKPFTWPAAIAMAIGGFGAVTMPSVGTIRLSLVLFGIGAAASPPAVTTLLMELPEMSPVKMGIGLAVVWSAGYAGAFVSPFLGGAIAEALGLKAVMLGFLTLQLLPICGLYLLPETGPAGRAIVEPAPAGGAR